MRKSILLIVCLASTIALFAQNYLTLTFTAKLQDNSFISLDSVKVTNITRGWSETLYYPDTTLQMTNSVGIEESESQTFKLYQNIPNPCKGFTSVRLQLPSNETVRLKMYDVNGKEVASYSEKLESGIHDFSLSVAAAQMYVLNVKTASQTQSLQLVSVESGKGYGIQHTSFVPSQQEPNQKAVTSNTFVSNDSMQFIGYCTYGGGIKTKTLTLTQAGSNTTHTFTLPMGYAVGDVYYNTSGIAEGIVCWLADTVITIGGIPYGNHGKIISLDEKDKAMYSTNNSGYPTRAYDSLDGRVNTAMHIAITLDTNYMFPERLEGAIWCTSKGEGWYFPAKREMYMLYNLLSILNASLQSIGAKTFTTVHTENPLYWSSTEEVQVGSNPCKAYGINMERGWVITSSVYELRHVRAMKWF